jgi:hypothetical protein
LSETSATGLIHGKLMPTETYGDDLVARSLRLIEKNQPEEQLSREYSQHKEKKFSTLPHHIEIRVIPNLILKHGATYTHQAGFQLQGSVKTKKQSDINIDDYTYSNV